MTTNTAAPSLPRLAEAQRAPGGAILRRVVSPNLDLQELERVVGAVAAELDEPEVLAVYVFGSQARGEARAASDLDVAVLETPNATLSLEAEDRLRRAIRSATGLGVDLVRLVPSSPVLAFEVLEGGRRVFVRDAQLADEIEERLLRRYLDTEHLRRVQREYLLGPKP